MPSSVPIIKSFLYVFLPIAMLTSVVYYYPRYLVKYFGENSPWIGYLYTYGMGALIFFLSVIWIFTRKKSHLRQKEEIFWFIILFFGLMFSFIMHGFWILWSIGFPTKF